MTQDWSMDIAPSLSYSSSKFAHNVLIAWFIWQYAKYLYFEPLDKVARQKTCILSVKGGGVTPAPKKFIFFKEADCFEMKII